MHANLHAGAPDRNARSCAAERIEKTLALLTEPAILIQARQFAHRAALDATIARDATVAELRRAMRQLKLDVNSILRVHPEINPPTNFS